MSTEAIPHQELTTFAWTTSLEAESDPSFNNLKDIAEDTFSPYEHLPWGFLGADPVYIAFEDIERDETLEEWDELGREHFSKSKIFAKAGIRERLEMIRAWRGDVHWIYSTDLSTDGLWDQDVSVRTYGADRMSRFVLSGMFGEQLLRDDKRLRKAATEFEGTPLDRAVLVGGAALAGSSEYSLRREVGATYRGTSIKGFIPETWTGGDFHGDFRTRRQMLPVQAVTTSLNQERVNHFMPVVGEGKAGSYYGTERDIVASLLYYQVAYQGQDATSLRERLFRTLSDYPIKVGGDFGDYGDKDGRLQEHMLRSRLKGRPTELVYGETMFGSIVDPLVPHRFEIIPEREGVRFVNTDEKRAVYDSIFIPANEVEEYLVTLIRGGGGRTSPHAMVRVIDGLIEE